MLDTSNSIINSLDSNSNLKIVASPLIEKSSSLVEFGGGMNGAGVEAKY